MKSNYFKQSSLFYKNFFKSFSQLEKLGKLEVNMRTPYNSIFRNFNGFLRVYVGTLKGQMCIQNKTPPTVYLLPAGEIKFINLVKGVGANISDGFSGTFVHGGGYAVVHP